MSIAGSQDKYAMKFKELDEALRRRKPYRPLVNLPAPSDNNAGKEDIKLAGLKKAEHGSKEDMEAFDQLGPETRKVLNDKMSVKWSSHETLKMVRQMGMNPQHAHTDAMIAHQLLHANGMVAAKLKVESLQFGTVFKTLS
jgi:hypothetical protein